MNWKYSPRIDPGPEDLGAIGERKLTQALARVAELEARVAELEAIPRPPEADRHAAIVEAAVAWREARRVLVRANMGTAHENAYRAKIKAEEALTATVNAEIAARAEGGEA